MRILLIGGNGFIGTPLTRQLHAGGHDLAIFHRCVGSAVDGIVHMQGDRNRLPVYLPLLRQFAPEVIVDLVLSCGDQAHQLMKVAGDLAARVVAVSSMDVYRAWGILQGIEAGSLEPLPLTEESPLRTARKLYSHEMIRGMQGIFNWLADDYDKIGVEEEVLRGGVPGTVMRLPMIYGPGDPLHRFMPVVKRVIDGRASIILPEDFAAWRSPRGYVDNVAHAIALAATSERAAGRVYNVAEESAYSELEWQTMIARQMGWKGEFVVLPRERTPKHLQLPANTAQHIVASTQRIRTELGYREPIALEEAMRRSIAWERENPLRFVPPAFDYPAEDEAMKASA